MDTDSDITLNCEPNTGLLFKDLLHTILSLLIVGCW